MNTKQMQAALAKINPKTAKATAVKAATHEPIVQRVAGALGAAVPVVRTNVGIFTSAFSTSYQYHEAVRKGLI